MIYLGIFSILIAAILFINEATNPYTEGRTKYFGVIVYALLLTYLILSVRGLL